MSTVFSIVAVLIVWQGINCKEQCDKNDEIIQTLQSWHDNNVPNTVEKVYFDMIIKYYYGSNAQQLSNRKRAHGHNNHTPHPHGTHHGHQYTVRGIEDEIKHLSEDCRLQIMQFIQSLPGMQQFMTTKSTTTTTATPKPVVTSTHVVTSKPVHVTTQERTPNPTTGHAQTTVTPTTQVPTTREPLNVSHSCDAVKMVMSLASGNIIQDSKAGLCTDGTHSQSEALIMHACAAASSTTWRQGLMVMENCDRIPAYTPISTFLFGQYAMDGTGLSGIFIECTGGGFKIAVQLCGHGPQIFEIEAGTGSGRQDAKNYYIVEWNTPAFAFG